VDLWSTIGSAPAGAVSPAFLVASLVIAVTPGPGVFYIITRSATQGRAAGLASVAGVALGNLGNSIAASLGLAALFAMSALLFSVTKYLGALYLIYLGIRALRMPATVFLSDVGLPELALRRIFLDGLLVALFNPKTALFFAAFLPQFLAGAGATAIDTIELSGAFVLIAVTTDSLYALLASTARNWFSGRPGVGRAGRYVSGSALIALGLYTGLTGRRAKP
jgi:threonine/homoserine/homoserine lactone efflux protein